MVLKLYCNLFSQPARCVYLLLEYSKASFEVKHVDILRGENSTEEYKKINKMKYVPVIEEDNGFILTETNAIIRYLVNTGAIKKCLYPEESKTRARIDEFLEWQYFNLRLPLSLAARPQILFLFNGAVVDKKRVESNNERMRKALEVFETKWLSTGRHFLLGDQISVADVLAACEVETHRILGFDFSEFSKTHKWNMRVKGELDPYFREVHLCIEDLIKS